MRAPDDQLEFWEASFIEKREMWGFVPAHSAVLTRDFFIEKSVSNILIPGIGYGRNAQVFRDAGMTVTGIEISKSAIDMARKHYGEAMIIHHGSVTDMPFDASQYDGIFCHALLHLLNGRERNKLISDCYRQLADNGYMVFSTISKQAPMYGQGARIGPDRYELVPGAKIYFHDRESIHAEFSGVGLVEVTEVQENHPFFLITCQKPATG